MTERDTGATRRNPRPSGSPHMAMEAMACGCRLLDRSENANCDTPTQGPSANPIRHSPMIRATRPLSFLALFRPTHLDPSTYLSLALSLAKRVNRYDCSFSVFFFSSLSLFFSFFFSTKGYDYVAGRETSNLVVHDLTRLDSTRLCPALPLGPTELDANRK